MTSNKKKNNKLDSAIICCICNDIIKPLMSNDVPPQIIWDKGNNAEPVKTGRCCDKCNLTEVLPARFQSINKEEDDDNGKSEKEMLESARLREEGISKDYYENGDSEFDSGDSYEDYDC